MSTNDILNIPKEKFTFIHADDGAEDFFEEEIFSAKPTGYFKDAISRFVKNKGSVVCFFIIMVLVLYAFLAPVLSPYKISDRDGYYAYATPRAELFSKSTFWSGTKKMEVNEKTYQYLQNIPGAVTKYYGVKERDIAGRKMQRHIIRVDTYNKTGWVKILLTPQEYHDARQWESQECVEGQRLFYPMLDEKRIASPAYKGDQNAWFLTDSRGNVILSDSGELQDIFLRVKLEDGHNAGEEIYFVPRMNGSQYETRVLYKEWYRYKNGHYASFIFGADKSGYDIFTRLAYGARLSLLLSICVAAINLFLGIVIGALEGYYGGALDLILERIKDILYDVPSLVIFALFQLYLANIVGPIVSMFFAFIFYGWIGTSSTVRAQMYRFKGQDYVLASRTLGAGDMRLIFSHILPNAIGFIITASVLTIPGVIFSEANLTYLGIVNLEGDSMTSVGTMLNAAKATLSTYPHCLFFPAAFISILLVCFNEFGNGLRDAFNPTLRGAEDA